MAISIARPARQSGSAVAVIDKFYAVGQLAARGNLRDWNACGRNRERIPNALRECGTGSAGKARSRVGQQHGSGDKVSVKWPGPIAGQLAATKQCVNSSDNGWA